MSKPPPTTLDFDAPRQRPAARWFGGLSLASHVLFMVAAWGIGKYVLPKRPPKILGLWQYRIEYDNLIPLFLLLLAALACAFAAFHAKARKERVRRRVMAIFIIELCAILMLIPVRSKSREVANRTKCASQLLQIGQGIQQYAAQNGGRLPDGFVDLLRLDIVPSPELLVCPSSNDQRALGSTTDALLADFALPNRCSYTYRGAELRLPLPSHLIIAHDNPQNHDYEGVHVLYSDGSVQWLAIANAQRLIPNLSTRRPGASTSPQGGP